MATPAPSLNAQNAAPDLVRRVSLPDELWTTIFEQLNFHDLRRVEMVCKRFQSLLKVLQTMLNVALRKTWLTERGAQDHQLASILFRAGPQEPIKKGQKLELHPLLEMVDCVGTLSGDPDKAACWLRDSDGNAYDLAAVDDFATRPACTKLRINMASTDVGTLTCKTGITIRQILRKTIPFWLRCFDGYFEGHVWWNGWTSAEGQEDGSVLLKAGMFDS